MTEETPIQPGSVPIAELEEFVKALHIMAETNRTPLPSGREKGREETYEICADELEQLIEEHKP